MHGMSCPFRGYNPRAVRPQQVDHLKKDGWVLWRCPLCHRAIPKSSNLSGIFDDKPLILGYPHCRKPPNVSKRVVFHTSLDFDRFLMISKILSRLYTFLHFPAVFLVDPCCFWNALLRCFLDADAFYDFDLAPFHFVHNWHVFDACHVIALIHCWLSLNISVPRSNNALQILFGKFHITLQGGKQKIKLLLIWIYMDRIMQHQTVFHHPLV